MAEKKQPNQRRQLQWILGVVLLGGALSFGGVFYAKSRVTNASLGRAFSDLNDVPEREVALILGCSKLLHGG